MNFTIFFAAKLHITEIPWLLLLCNERQMPTHGASKRQTQDESQTQGVDFPKQWLGTCQEKAKT